MTGSAILKLSPRLQRSLTFGASLWSFYKWGVIILGSIPSLLMRLLKSYLLMIYVLIYFSCLILSFYLGFCFVLVSVYFFFFFFSCFRTLRRNEWLKAILREKRIKHEIRMHVLNELRKKETNLTHHTRNCSQHVMYITTVTPQWFSNVRKIEFGAKHGALQATHIGHYARNDH